MASYIPPAGAANSFANAHVTLRVAERSSMDALDESARAERELAEALADQARNLEVGMSQVAVGTTVMSSASSVQSAGAKYFDAKAAEETKSVLGDRPAPPKDQVVQKQEFIRGEALKQIEQVPAQLTGTLPREINKRSKDIGEVAERQVGMRQVLSDSASVGAGSMRALNATFAGQKG